MIDDPKIKQAIALISDAIADAYQRGKVDAINAMLAAASGAMQQPQEVHLQKMPPSVSVEEDSRVRAPRGSTERVIKRAIARSEGRGVTVPEIMSAREGELEMMLVDSSVRGELRRGEKVGKYVEIDGRWFEPS